MEQQGLWFIIFIAVVGVLALLLRGRGETNLASQAARTEGEMLSAAKQRMAPPVSIEPAADIPELAADSDEEDDATAPEIRVLDYNFREFDFGAGPPDRDSFYGELVVQLQDDVHNHRWTNSYIVCTPAGLKLLMEEEHCEAFWPQDTLIVPVYDGRNILRAVCDRIFGRYERPARFVPLGDQ